MAQYTTDSSFNMGIAHLERIDSLLYSIAENSAKESFADWLIVLNVLNREINFLYSPDETKEATNLNNNCTSALINYNSERNYENKTKLYNALVDYEYFIKRQLATRKMLMAFSKDVKVSIADLQ